MTAEQRQLLSLRAELDADLQMVQLIVREIEAALGDVSLAKRPDLVTMMGLAALLHHFYSAIESSFERIVKYFDGGVPAGETWHRDLLGKVAIDVPGLRPAVISKDLQKQLDDYRRFRHLFRRVYELSLDWEKLVPLLHRLPATHVRLQRELRQFTAYVAALAAGDTQET